MTKSVAAGDQKQFLGHAGGRHNFPADDTVHEEPALVDEQNHFPQSDFIRADSANRNNIPGKYGRNHARAKYAQAHFTE